MKTPIIAGLLVLILTALWTPAAVADRQARITMAVYLEPLTRSESVESLYQCMASDSIHCTDSVSDRFVLVEQNGIPIRLEPI